ncbi:hypothetical protein ACFX1T_022247 [Malus domestica]
MRMSLISTRFFQLNLPAAICFIFFSLKSFSGSVVKMVRFGGETVTQPSSPSGAWEDKGYMGVDSESVGESSNIIK